VTDAAQIERARLNVTLTLYAIARLVEAQATGDARFIVAAEAIKQIADTMESDWRRHSAADRHRENHQRRSAV
jgi:hypothetical protein